MTQEVDKYARFGNGIIGDLQAHYRLQQQETAQAEVDRLDALEQQAEPENLLGVESLELILQMRRLYKRRWFSKLLGSGAVHPNGKYLTDYDYPAGVTTDPILGFEVGNIEVGETMPDAHVAVRYIFGTDLISSHHEKLQITQNEVDSVSGSSRATDRWQIVIPTTGDEPLQATVDSPGLTTQRMFARLEIVEDFQRAHPWLANFSINLADGEDSVRIERNLVPSGYDIITGTGPDFLPEPEAPEREEVFAQLQEQMKRGAGWDYAETPVLFLLGLVMNARKELARGQFLPKLLK